MSGNELTSRPLEPSDVLFSSVRVLDPRERIDAPHDVLVRDGAVAELAPPGTLAAPEGVESIDGGGRLCLAPAFFDPHVHLRSPGQEHKEDLDTGTRAAAAGGFACVVAMPNTSPVIDSPSLLRSLRDSASRHANVPVGFLPAITVGLEGGQLTEMAELRDEGALGFTDDGRPVTSARTLRKALQYQRLCGGVIALHEEDPTLSRGGAMNEGSVSAALGVTGVPTISESTMVARDAEIAAFEQARVHFQHLSCEASVRAVAQARERGARVSCEVTPHHLLLTEEDVRSLDTSRKMNPPLATEADRLALVEALRDGTIDCVATDHAPHARDEKEVPFEEAPMGTTGLETAFAALHGGLVVPGVLELATLIERLTAGAALFGLPTARIATGARADLVLLDLEDSWVAGEHGWQSRAANSCFAGKRMHGRVVMTLCGGAIVAPARDGRGARQVSARIDPADTLLVTIDVQEAFRGYECFARVAEGCCRLLAGARAVQMAAVVSEQYPRGLGASAPELGIAGETVLAKTCFSAAAADGFDSGGRGHAILCGIETHVCVEHTARDLLGRGMGVHVVADACGSRHDVDGEWALVRLRDLGAVVETVESILFALFDGSGSPEFKQVQGLVK